MSFGVLSTGFEPKQFEDIRAELLDEFKLKYGPIRSDSQSMFGLFLDLISTKFADLWAVAQDVYLSRSISAEGTALDDIVYWSGVTRLPATKSALYVVMYGTNGTSIPTNTTIRGYTTNNEFVLNSLSPLTISNTSVAACTIDITYVTGFNYTIGLDIGVAYTSVAGNTAAIVAAALASQINSGSAVATASVNADDQLEIVVRDFTYTTMVVTLSSNLAFNKSGTAMPFASREYGAIPAPVGELIQIITPVSGLNECYNFEEAVIGREIETDTELRTRFLEARSSLGYASLNAIRNRVLQEVSTVSSCYVYENNTAVTVDSIPPHSIQVVVDCPTIAEQSVAEKIWEIKSAGIGTYGAVSKTVLDSQGGSHIVNLSKVVTQYLYMTVAITQSAEVAFPIDGSALVKQAIVDFVNSFSIGQDLVYQSFYHPIYSIPGIASVTFQTAVAASIGGSYTLGTSTIVVPKTTRVSADVSRITVTVL